MKVVDCTGDILLFYVTLISRLLPTYITAAFIKKLARMALTAPPSAALLVIEFIINLLIRHNTCRFLIHRDTCCDEQTDPFLPLQADLSKCRAAESSLWEIKVSLFYDNDAT